ncbi:MAG: hypothetical protein ACR2NP_22950 [Pirellulaceae bacterium]
MSKPSQRRLVLLGPQPEYVSLREALGRLDITSPVAFVTAGWEDEENDPQQLQPLVDALPAGSFNLNLFERSEQLFADDSEVIELLRDRQDELRHLRDVYRMRLDCALDAARRVVRRQEELIDIQPERESAIDMVRQLDRDYFERTGVICHDYERRLGTARRPQVKLHREKISKQLDQAAAIVISGGHAAIILNRLKIFGLLETHTKLPIIAWSAGAMALSQRVVFFHDSPPQGRGNPEVLRAGMALFRKYLPLPDARNRLRLDDKLRVELFSRRFNSHQCVIFDEHTLLDRKRGRWTVSDRAQRLGENGQLVQVSA